LISRESMSCQSVTVKEKITTASPETLVRKYSPLCLLFFIYIPVINQSI
jgi:hypothetical protein